MRGTIKVLQYKSSRPLRSYGFIRGDDGKDYYFSLLEVLGLDELSIGTTVEFKGDQNAKGYVAREIHLAQ